VFAGDGAIPADSGGGGGTHMDSAWRPSDLGVGHLQHLTESPRLSNIFVASGNAYKYDSIQIT